MHYHRDILPTVERLAEQFPALVVTGGRQTGKTTLLREVFPNHHYVSLDLPSAAELAEADPESFPALNPPPVLIDEVQYAPKLFRHLKIEIDRRRHERAQGARDNGAFVLTGSQKFVLMKEVSDSLAGRAAVVELETLSFEELAQHTAYPATFENLVATIVRGGFPELWRDRNIDGTAFYHAYLSSYLERDVRQILNVASLRDFERFIRACATRTAQLLDKASLARDVGVSPKAINDWLSVLEASNQIQLLEPYFENLGKRLIKSPKLYFSDTGLLCYLLALDERSLPSSPYLGAIWETTVYAQLRKKRDREQGRATLWFYRDAQQREVDFVVSEGNDHHLIEAKWSENPELRDAKTLLAVAETLRERSKATRITTALACRTPHRSVIASETRVLDLATLGRPGWGAS